jgi:cytidylate kinase
MIKSGEGFVVTIDGPAASGKSSVARALAGHFGWDWLSTGAFYRALAVVAKIQGVDLRDGPKLADLARSASWRVCMAEARTRAFLGDQEITDRIYGEAIGADASLLSHHSEVRQALLAAQRACAEAGKGLVAEGRDCGTVVFPQAQVKIYLTARSESRAERRALEQGLSVAETKAAQVVRDQQDSERKAAPLQVPEGAHLIDTSELSLAQVVAKVIDLVAKRLGGASKSL